MMDLDARELLQIELRRVTNLDALQGKKIKGVSTDSRSTKPGDVFFAIRGERFDGHDFVRDAFSRGCVTAVVEESFRGGEQEWSKLPLIYVENSVRALGQFARRYRRKFDIPVLAITGSNGKTTTKEMVGTVLKQKWNVLKTEGNLNNQIGIPHTLFRLERKHEVAVVEMATNHFGEIEYLCTVAEPTHGMITNIGRAHLEFFGDLHGVAKEKAKLFEWLGATGTGFVNTDDRLIVEKAKTLRHKFTYGFQGKRVNVTGRFLGLNEAAQPKFSFGGHPLSRSYKVQLKTTGKHTVENALAAAAVGVYFGVSPKKIRSALENYRPRHQRMEVMKVRGVTILNDTYNANPDSVLSALRTLDAMKCTGKKIVVLGDMLELGTASEREHRRVGEEVARLGVHHLLTYGLKSSATAKASGATRARHYEEKPALMADLAELVAVGDVVLVKGSRAMKMEEVVTFLADRLRGDG